MNIPEQQIGPYTIVEELGSGGFGIVYRAIKPPLNQAVALKLLKPVLMADPEFVTRFKQEAQNATNLQHSHLVRVFDFVDESGRLGIVSDYLPGGDLKERLTARALSLDETVSIITQVGNALDFMHKQGMIHRDVKPSNILFNAGEQAVLTDFGIAKALHGTQVEMGADSAEAYYVTTTGGAVGTPAYMAPEQIMGEAMDGRVDVYALGIVAYEMLTGTVPFKGKPTKVHHGHVYEAPPPLTEQVPALPPPISDVVLQALAKAPEDRYATAAAFAQALKAAAEQAEVAWLPEQLQKIDTLIKEEDGLDRAIARVEIWARLFPDREDVAGKLKELRARKRYEALYAEIRELWEEAQARAKELVARVPDAPDPDGILAPLLETHAAPASSNAPSPARPAAENKRFPRWAWGVIAVVALVLAVGAGIQLIPPQGTKTPAALSTPTKTVSDLEPGTTRMREADDMTQVYVPAGEFAMGSEQGDADEQPVHTVALDTFWLDKTEVTNAQYQTCVTASVCDPLPHIDNSDYNAPDQPVLGVDWESAIIYCGWVGGRLPTEAEWEYAARGPESLIYPWGHAWQMGLANCKESQCEDGYEDPAPVGSFPAGESWVGALDMAGNVWEWVADWYDAGYYAHSPRENPTGPEDGQHRVLRGGSWASFTDRLRSSYRHRLSAISANINRGFRCVEAPLLLAP